MNNPYSVNIDDAGIKSPSAMTWRPFLQIGHLVNVGFGQTDGLPVARASKWRKKTYFPNKKTQIHENTKTNGRKCTNTFREQFHLASLVLALTIPKDVPNTEFP